MAEYCGQKQSSDHLRKKRSMVECCGQKQTSSPQLTDESIKTKSSLVKSCGQKQTSDQWSDESVCEFIYLSSMSDQLLTEVLVRLPSDCACRCKAVCKRWCSLISSSYFVSRFFSVAPAPTPNTFTLVFRYDAVSPSRKKPRRCPLYPIGAISNHPVLSKAYENQCVDLSLLPNVMLPNYPQQINVMSSSLDLLLCSHLSRYYVVNLLNKQWILLPPAPTRDFNLEPRTLMDNLVFFKAGLLCYYEKNDIGSGNLRYKFKVIMIPCVHGNPPPIDGSPVGFSVPPEIYDSRFSIRIYCSESKQWTDYAVDWYPLSWNAHLALTPILSHKGMLHWLNGRSLVSLDHRHIKLCHSIDLPEELSFKTVFGFGMCQGFFRVAYLIPEEALVLLVWDLKDYDKGEWQLAHRVLLSQSSLAGYSRSSLRLLAFHPYDGDILFLRDKECIQQFNMRTGRLERTRKLNPVEDRKGLRVTSVVPPLLHQWFPTPVPSP